MGEALAWGVRRVSRWRPSPVLRRRAWLGLAVVGGAFIVVTLIAGWRWQVDIHRLMNVSAPPGYESVTILGLGLLMFAGLVGLGRVLRRLARWIVRRTLGRLPLWAARAVAVVAVTLLVIGVLSGVIFRTFIAVSNALFSVRDTATTEGTVRPTAPERSGSPASIISWDSLGRKGRDFVGLGPTAAEITGFSGAPAAEPIRVYAGLESAPSVDDRGQQRVRELSRRGASERKALIVVTTTGTGWDDRACVDH